jgi:FHS family L-fucose permease-like MFS transporter
MGVLLVAIFLAVLFVKMPIIASNDTTDTSLSAVFSRLLRNVRYREGVVAQFFYVGVQIMCWTLIIQYGTDVFMGDGMTEKAAEILSQKYNMVAMCLFCVSRFVCTFLLRFINPGKLLSALSVVAICLLTVVILVGGHAGLCCLVAVSACMSLMFPTIYGISLEGVSGEDAKIGAAGLIMAILGGSLLPPIQASIIDLGSVSMSFLLPLFCFVVIAIYGWRHSRG